MNSAYPKTSIAQRKEQLVAEGAAWRAGIGLATRQVTDSLRAESLAKSALSYMAMAAYGVFKSRSGAAGIGLQTVLPLLISGVTALSKKSLFKKVLRGALVVGVAGAVASIVVARKKARQRAALQTDPN